MSIASGCLSEVHSDESKLYRTQVELLTSKDNNTSVMDVIATPAQKGEGLVRSVTHMGLLHIGAGTRESINQLAAAFF